MVSKYNTLDTQASFKGAHENWDKHKRHAQNTEWMTKGNERSNERLHQQISANYLYNLSSLLFSLSACLFVDCLWSANGGVDILPSNRTWMGRGIYRLLITTSLIKASFRKPTWLNSYTIPSLRWMIVLLLQPKEKNGLVPKTNGPGIYRNPKLKHACMAVVCFNSFTSLHDVRTILPILLLSSIPVRALVYPRWLRASILYWLHLGYSCLSLQYYICTKYTTF